jgi:predicted nucleotidyltransferase
MIKRKRLAYDLVKELIELPLRSVILFGSTATGKNTTRSDIDILICFDTEKEIMQTHVDMVNAAVARLEKREKVKIQAVFANRTYDGFDEHFLKSLMSDGIVLYGKDKEMSFQGKKLKPCILISYDLKNISQKEKNRFNKELAGFSNRKEVNGRVYKSARPGLMHDLHAIRLGRGALLIPAARQAAFIALFKKYSIEYTRIDVWQ